MRQAIVLKRNQRKLTRKQKEQAGIQTQSQPAAPEWTPHIQPVALDAWGMAVRKLRKEGVNI